MNRDDELPAARSRPENNIGYGTAGLVGCAYAFVVFVVSYNYSYEALLSRVWLLYILLALTTFSFSLSRRADPVVVFACINGPALLVWYAVIPEQLPYYIPLIIITTVSGIAAFVGRRVSNRFRHDR